MKHFMSWSKISLTSVVIGFFLSLFPLTESYATAGCCSRHGGVSGCNTSTNHLYCKDGTTSPTCLCQGGTSSTPIKKITQPKTVKESTKTMDTTEKSMPTTKTKTTEKTKVTEKAVKEKESTAGCCSRHGGVAKCDKKAGYQLCKDGTHSTACKC